MAIVLTFALEVSTAAADPPRNGSEFSDRRHSENRGKAGRALSLDQAVGRVRRDTGGRILSAETIRKNNRPVHRIKVLTRDRRVRTIFVDAKSPR